MKQIEEKVEKFVPEEKTANEDRLVMLCDGVFAIAITLLVLDIGISVIQGKSPESTYIDDVNAKLRSLVEPTISYLVTFFIISVYWKIHRNLMRVVQRLDNGFISLTFLFLAFVAFFPVTSKLLGDYADDRAIVIIYTLVLSGCGLSAFVLWFYATWKHRLVSPDLSQEEIRAYSYKLLFTPLTFSASLLLLFAVPLYQPYLICFSWALIGLAERMAKTIYKRWLQKITSMIYKRWLEKPIQALIHHEQEGKLPASSEVDEAQHTVQEPGQTLIPLPLEHKSKPLAAPIAQASQEVVEQTHIQEEA